MIECDIKASKKYNMPGKRTADNIPFFTPNFFSNTYAYLLVKTPNKDASAKVMPKK